MEVRYRHLERRVAFAVTASRVLTPTPNTRLQRTRGAGFARTSSPLSRKPLGLGSTARRAR
jgi:hypothetical protein